ncbi:acetylcholinesterase-1-like isoform X2 [Dermacentor albipictus]|uniref:acetylcholinesterase-1-like isoform X2 n=1 Tax=Dermacentor albipictus TaxID=60249 RepID=UPI0038FC86DA
MAGYHARKASPSAVPGPSPVQLQAASPSVGSTTSGLREMGPPVLSASGGQQRSATLQSKDVTQVTAGSTCVPRPAMAGSNEVLHAAPGATAGAVLGRRVSITQRRCSQASASNATPRMPVRGGRRNTDRSVTPLALRRHAPFAHCKSRSRTGEDKVARVLWHTKQDEPKEGVQIDEHVSWKWKAAYITNAMVCLVFIFLLLIMGVRSGSRSLVVQTCEGDVEGVHLPAVPKVRGEVYAFYGVPYGLNTGGHRRFAPPEPALLRNEVIRADHRKPACPQFAQVPVLDEIAAGTSEDCLHLNVWTPSILRCSTGCQQKPVIVFFYGRDFEHGFSDYQYYDGTTLSGFSDVVVVVPSYRLGVFGFLNANTTDAPGNVGLLDQQLALSWVYNNIASFNGDPNNVALVGHDTGASSLGYLMMASSGGGGTPRSSSRFVFHSGSPLRVMPDNTGAAAITNMHELAKRLSCPLWNQTQVLACLREVSVANLTVGARQMSLALGPRFGPSLDVRPLPGLQEPSTYAANREVLIGRTAGEGRFMLNLLEQTVLQGDAGNATALALRLEDIVHEFFQGLNFTRHQQRLLEDVQASVDRSGLPSLSAWRDFVGSVLVECPMQYFVEALAQSSTASVYVFEFAHRKLGHRVQVTTRGDDIDLLFGVPFEDARSGPEVKLSEVGAATNIQVEGLAQVQKRRGGESSGNLRCLPPRRCLGLGRMRKTSPCAFPTLGRIYRS